MKVIAFTGAGISKSAGIPTFEEVDGLKEMLSVEFKKARPIEFREATNLLKSNVKDKEPTNAHKVLAEYNITIITMNIDGLHQKAGSTNVIEIHGNAEKDNIVLYGQEILRYDDVISLISETVNKTKKSKENSCMLVIGTSMQTAFANYIAKFAAMKGMELYFINQNADKEVEYFFKRNISQGFNKHSTCPRCHAQERKKVICQV